MNPNVCSPDSTTSMHQKRDLTSWEGHPSRTLNKSLQEGAIICSMLPGCHVRNRALFDMCPYSDRIAVLWIQKNRFALFDGFPGRIPPGVAATKTRVYRISTYMIFDFSPLQLGPLAYQEFSNPYIFIVRDGCFLLSNLESEGVHKSLGES